MSLRLKRCEVVYAGARRQWQVTVELAPQATVAEAIGAARQQVVDDELDWEGAPVGIFGVHCGRDAVPAEGDRIELYRPLRADPRERRRRAARIR